MTECVRYVNIDIDQGGDVLSLICNKSYLKLVYVVKLFEFILCDYEAHL